MSSSSRKGDPEHEGNVRFNACCDALRPGGTLVIVEFDRVEGESPEFVLEPIRASTEQFTDEIEANGFRLIRDATVDGMMQTFVRHFEKR